MKIDLRMKATFLVGIITFFQADHSCCRFLEQLGFNKVVNMKNEQGDLTREGKLVMSLFFALVTYMVMSHRGSK